MHRFLIFSLVFFLVFPMNAVTFDELCEKLTAHRVTSGTFLQEKTAKALKKPLLSSGTFRIDENGIEWRTEKPFKSTMKVNKTELIQISADGKTTKMDGSSNAPPSLLPHAPRPAVPDYASRLRLRKRGAASKALPKR